MVKPAGTRANPRSSAAPTPRGSFAARRDIPLLSLDQVAAEMARLYRSMLRGETHENKGAKMGYVLMGLFKIIEATSIERRLAALEELEFNPLPLLGDEQEHDHAQ